MLDVLMPLMACSDKEEDDLGDSEDPGSYARNVLDTICLHLPSGKMLECTYQLKLSNILSLLKFSMDL